jgi:hypothetical protein
MTITSDDLIELHISRHVGNFSAGYSPIWRRASYGYVNPAFLDHCRAFADWLDSMYNPATGAVYHEANSRYSRPPENQGTDSMGLN